MNHRVVSTMAGRSHLPAATPPGRPVLRDQPAGRRQGARCRELTRSPPVWPRCRAGEERAGADVPAGGAKSPSSARSRPRRVMTFIVPNRRRREFVVTSSLLNRLLPNHGGSVRHILATKSPRTATVDAIVFAAPLCAGIRSPNGLRDGLVTHSEAPRDRGERHPEAGKSRRFGSDGLKRERRTRLK